MKKLTSNDFNVCFSFDDLNIIGVKGENTYIIGTDGDNKECVIILSRQLLAVAFEKWLTTKKKYCEMYNEFCGVGGFISAAEFVEYPEENRCFILDNDKIENIQADENNESIYKTVRTFEVSVIEDYCDMEHG